jgi:hypothetical protein
MQDVGAAWSGQHTIRSTTEFWEQMTVGVTVAIVEDSAHPHYTVIVAKMPPDAPMVGSVVTELGHRTGVAQLDSNDLRQEAKLDWEDRATQIEFAAGSSSLDSEAARTVQTIVDHMTRDPATHVTLVGHADTSRREGDTAQEGAIANMDMARARTATVALVLNASGIRGYRILEQNVGEGESSAASAKFRRVDALVSSRGTQSPALHETGHMLALADDYPTPGHPAGKPVEPAYSSMVRSQTGYELVAADTESAMSLGSRVQPWHYGSFLEALVEITEKTNWRVEV